MTVLITSKKSSLLSRQFVEITRGRIEGLLAAFPKLLESEKSTHGQHTFIETESVRYVYQPMDQLYILLITTKASNILEDLETLRLFSRVIGEYCEALVEKVVLKQAFHLIFAFDEIVALGYRESVNLGQIRTYTEMDSHEERVFYQIKQVQEEEAKKRARDMAREISMNKQEALKRGGREARMDGAVRGYHSARFTEEFSASAMSESASQPSYSTPAHSTCKAESRALILGRKSGGEENFLKQLRSEGQDVTADANSAECAASGQLKLSALHATKVEPFRIHLKMEEKISLSMSREGKLDSLEVLGLLMLRITDENFRKIKIQLDKNEKRGTQIQVHPNFDKKVFQSNRELTLKDSGRPFPINNFVEVLKWRFHSKEDKHVPFQINCWPSQSQNGFEVNIEYSLENKEFELHGAVIQVPLPIGATPVILDCDGDYMHDRPKQMLEWILPLVNKSNKSGSLEFITASGNREDFFPIRVGFTSRKLFCDIDVEKVISSEDSSSVIFSKEATLLVDKYEVM